MNPVSTPRRTFVFSIVVVVGGLLTLQGCMTSLIRETGTEHQAMLDVDVNQIEPVSLQALSTDPPISIEAAAQKFREQSVDREHSQKSLSLSIADVRAGALANNLELKVDLVNPSLAQETWVEERAKFEAVFYGGLSYSDSLTPTASELEGSQSNVMQYEVGIRQPLPTGGQIEISHPGTRYETNNKYSTLNPSFETDLQFSLTQPILRGAGLRSNTNSIRVAKLEQKAVDAQTKLDAIRILADADKAYWRVYGASEELFVNQQQYQLASRQLEEARLRVKAGAAPQVEITRAESGMASRRESIIVALTTLRMYERELKRIMNRPDLPMDSECALIPTTDPAPLGLKLDPQQLAQLAVQNRMEMLELELRLAIDASKIDYAKNNRLPYFAVDYSYNLNGLGKTFGNAYSQMSEGDYRNWSIGLQGEIPLGNQAANARLRYALLTRAQRLSTRELRRQAIQQEVYDTVDLLDQNWQRILAAQQDVVFSTRTYEAERKQFELGVRTSTDVLYAAAQLASAQLREIQALVDYQIAQVDIAYATGTLLGEAGVQWQAENL